MPKRLVNGDGVWRSQKLRQVEVKYRSEYANMLPLAGDRGTFECDPASIWADVFAYNRPDIIPDDVESILAEFERVKLLFRWQQDGKSWGYWVGIEKAGLLPKPSERFSKEPVPDADELTRFTGGSPAPHQPDTRGQDAAEARTGFGPGSGIGSGSGLGEERTVSQSVHNNNKSQTGSSVLSSSERSRGAKSQNQDTTLTVLQITDRFSEHIPEYCPVRPNDPFLPMVTSLTDERLQMFVKDGIPLDTPKIEGGMTARESCASMAWSHFRFAATLLWILNQRIPVAKPGTTDEFPEGDIEKMMRTLGWPNMGSDSPTWEDMSPGLFAAIIHWAFKSSSFWGRKLGTLDDVIRNMPTLRKQYDKYYLKVPEGQKPHDLHTGWPDKTKEKVWPAAPLCATCGKNPCPRAPKDAWEGARGEDGYYLNCAECDPPSVIPPPNAIEGDSFVMEDVNDL